MSFPVPISVITALDTPRSGSKHARNISSPYSLTVPQGKKPWTARPASPAAASSIYSEHGSEAFFAPTYPQKALIYSEKATSPYDDNISKTDSVSSRRYQQTNSDEPERRNRRPWWRENDRVLALAVTIGLVVVLSIAIPLGILVPQKYIAPLPVNILVPSTVSPEDGGWKRLTDSIINHHELNFTIVINPDNGPGSNSTPSDEYVKAIKDLNIYPNVQTIGWIDTEGGLRDNATVRAEIERYSNWSSVEGLALHGIYLDHTPYKDDGNSSLYLKNISTTIRDAKGFLDTNLVVHNPGRVPEESIMDSQPNVTVVYNGAYGEVPTREQMTDSLKGLGKREEFAVLVSSTPKDLGRVRLRRLVESFKRDVQWMYVTDLMDLSVGGYGSLWEQWLELVW